MKDQIPLVDLNAQYRKIKHEIDKAIQKVIDKSDFIMGEEVESFEEEFERFHEVEAAVGVSSGTDAIHLVLKSLGITKGDEIIIPSLTFTATAEPVVWLGATPVFVDINPDNFTINVNDLERKITKNTKAIIPVHLYGHPADLNQIMKIAGQNHIPVIEDAAQAHGAKIKFIRDLKYKWKTVGGIGLAGCFSFYPGKNLGAYGDAGMIVTNSNILAGQVRLLRNHGREEKYTHQIVGYGNRLDTLQAAILNVKIKHLALWNKARRQKAFLYHVLLKDLKEIGLPLEEKWAKSVYHLYVIRAKDRDKLKKYLKDKGIDAGIHYPIPLHLQPAYQYLGYKKGDLPVSEKASSEILSLPLYPELTSTQIEYIAKCLKNFYSY